jgi:hypothetical protein
MKQAMIVLSTEKILTHLEMLGFIFSGSIFMKNKDSKSQLPGFTSEGSLMVMGAYRNLIMHKALSDNMN